MPTYTNTTRYALRKPAINQKVNDFTAIIGAHADDVDAKMVGWVTGTAAGLPTAGTAGRFLRATDTKIVSFDDGSKLHTIPTLMAARGHFTASGTVNGIGSTGLGITADYDPEGAISANVYVCQKAGPYMVSAQTAVTSGASGSVLTQVFKNGGSATQGSTAPVSSGVGAYTNCSDIIQCAVNDQLQPAIYVATAIACTLVVSSSTNYLAVVPLC